jgi:hypothetical protein
MTITAIRQAAIGLSVRQRFFIATLLVGAGVFCIGDHFYHVRHGILVYHWTPLVDGQSVWVWPVFIVGAVAMLAISHRFTRGSTAPSTPEMLFNFAWIHGIYLSTALWGDAYPVAFITAMVGLWLLRIALLKEDRARNAALSLLLAVGASLLEGLFSQLGMFDYVQQDFARVPWWLFAAYLHAGPAIFCLSRWVRNG